MKHQVKLLLAVFALMLIACSGSSSSGTGLTAQNSGRTNVHAETDSVYLSWGMAGTEFTIRYYDGLNNLLGEKTTSDTNYSFSGLAVNESYTFVITSETGETSVAHAYVGTEQAQPGKITAFAMNNQAEIIWQALPNITGYDLYMSSDETKDFVKVIANTSFTSAIISNLENDKTYYFRVVALYDQKEIKKLTSVTTMSVLPGYTFGEVTAVTPGDAPDRTPRVFKAYIRGNNAHFMWDAVAYAVSYNIYHSSDNENYELLINVTDNSYILALPPEDPEKVYLRVSAVFNPEHIGIPSQFIKLRYRLYAEWDLEGGIESVTATMYNYDDFKNVDLACQGVTETEWLVTTMLQSPFTAGPLEAMDYFCKLILTHDDDVITESDTKRVTVLPYPDQDERLSVLVFENTAELRWDRIEDNDTYAVLLSTDDGVTVTTVVDGITEIEYLITNLKCGIDYTTYIKIYRGGEILISTPVTFTLDLFYCSTLPPDEGEEDIDCEVDYDIVSNQMKLLGNGSFPKGGYFKSTSLNCKIYLFGNNSAPKDLLHEYDIKTNQWNAIDTSPKPTGRRNLNLHGIGNKIYLIGGHDTEPFNDTCVFDTNTRQWNVLKPLNQPPVTNKTASVLANDKIYLFGGGNTELWVFDPNATSEGTWTQLTSAPADFTHNYNTEAGVIDNKIYFFGGSNVDVGRGTVTDTWRYDIASDSWRKMEPTDKAISRHRHGAAVIDKKFYIYGGDTYFQNYLNDLWVYDPYAGPEGSWTKLAYTGNKPSASRGVSMLAVGKYLYIMSGYAGSTSLNTLHVYKP